MKYVTIFLLCRHVQLTHFSISTHFSLNQEIYAKYSWNAHNCTILSARVEQNSENNTRYRIIANVTMATLPTLNQNTTAYYGPSPTYTLTKQAANKSYTNLTIGNTICWVRLISPARVSITKITKSHIPFNNTIYVAWSATFLAALSGVLFLIVFSQNLNNFLEQRTLGPDGVTITAATKSPFLSSQQTRHVCRMYADNVSAADLNDWTCSICLEQDSHAEVVNTVRLPCQHRFHRL